MSETISPAELHYASAALGGPSHSARVWAGVAICFAGLILVFFGGCFLIGIMIQLESSANAFAPTSATIWTSRNYVFHAVLYSAAITCFVCGAWVICRGLAGLLRVMNGKVAA